MHYRNCFIEISTVNYYIRGWRDPYGSLYRLNDRREIQHASPRDGEKRAAHRIVDYGEGGAFDQGAYLAIGRNRVHRNL